LFIHNLGFFLPCVLVLIGQLKNRPIGPPKLFWKVQLWRKDDISSCLTWVYGGCGNTVKSHEFGGVYFDLKGCGGQAQQK